MGRGRRWLSVTFELALGLPPQRWRHVARNDSLCRELVDGVGLEAPHYSRQSVGAADFMGSGKTFVLRADFAWNSPWHERYVDSRAVWGVIENFDGSRDGTRRFRCSIFRNETPWLSSELIREATALTYERWARRFQWSGSPPPDHRGRCEQGQAKTRSRPMFHQGGVA